MRQDIRVKVDISKIYRDARQYSWVFIDSTKILYVNQLVEHVRKLFDIQKPFHLLSRYEETLFFLPFEEDVRILENNDTVVIVPGTGIVGNCDYKYDEEPSLVVNGFVEPPKYKERDSSISSQTSFVLDKSVATNSDADAALMNGTLYKTAMHETAINDTIDSKMTEDLTEENLNTTEDSTISTKRKRVRKKKKKNPTDVVPESDTSFTKSSSGKKPKIIDSILISSGKHIRFKGLDDEDITSANGLNRNDIQGVKQNGDVNNKQLVNKELSALLNLRQSSTPLTFSHKRIKRDLQPEPIVETGNSMEIDEVSNKSKKSLELTKSLIEPEKSNNISQTNNLDDSTVSFKVFRMGEDYTPQLSSVILAKMMSTSADGEQYTLKILHGKDQLQDPAGKFSLPEDKEDNKEGNDMITIEKSQLLDFSKVKALGTS